MIFFRFKISDGLHRVEPALLPNVLKENGMCCGRRIIRALCSSVMLASPPPPNEKAEQCLGTAVWTSHSGARQGLAGASQGFPNFIMWENAPGSKMQNI